MRGFEITQLDERHWKVKIEYPLSYVNHICHSLEEALEKIWQSWSEDDVKLSGRKE